MSNNTEMRFHIVSPQWEQKLLNGANTREVAALPSYLMNFAAGRDPTPSAEFYPSLESRGVLNRLIADDLELWNDIPRLQQYEYGRIPKYGPQGWLYPINDPGFSVMINRYYENCHRPCRYSDETIKEASRRFGEADLTAMSFDKVVKRELEKTGLDSNSGLPYFTKRYKVIDKSISLAEKKRDGLLDDVADAAIIGGRCIRQAERLIFMAPYDQNLRELSYVYPIMDYLRANFSFVAGWGGPIITEIALQEHLKSNVTHISTDFTKMDTSVGPAQVSMFYEVTKHAFPVKERAEWKKVLLKSFTQPVILADVMEPGRANISRKGNRLVALTGTHGLFSGLGFTNLVETVLSMMNDIEYSRYYPLLATQDNGDDGMKTIDRHVKDLDKVASDFAKVATRAGFVCNAEKQFVSYDEIHYLQRVYSPETERGGFTFGAYPAVLAVNSAKNPERSSYLNGWERAVRLIEIAENCRGHPKWEAIAEFFAAGNRSLNAYLSSGARSEEITGLLQSRMGRQDVSNSARDVHNVPDFALIRYFSSHPVPPISDVAYSSSRGE